MEVDLQVDVNTESAQQIYISQINEVLSAVVSPCTVQYPVWDGDIRARCHNSMNINLLFLSKPISLACIFSFFVFTA